MERVAHALGIASARSSLDLEMQGRYVVEEAHFHEVVGIDARPVQ